MDSIIPLTVVSFALAYASFTDVTQFKVYNVLTFPLLISGLAYGAFMGGWSGIGFAINGAVIGLVILLLPYLMGGLGAGDVKFVMAVGSWIGAPILLPSIVIGSLVVVGYHMVIVARRRGISGIYQNIELMVFRLSCFGKNLALNDQFESVQSAANTEGSQNKGRLIPFSAMMSIGIVIMMAIAYFLRQQQ